MGARKHDRRTLRWIRVRVFLLSAGFGVGFLLLAARAVDLQYVQRARFQELASGQTLREVVLAPRRGRIEDRHGEALALSVDVPSIRADPSRLEDRSAAATKLARVLSIDAKNLERRFAKGRYFAWVKRRVSPEEAAAVRRLGLRGVGTTTEARRFYPHRDLAAHIIGFAGIDGRGLEGLELQLDRHLRGTSRSASALRDARGNRLLSGGGLDPAQRGGATVTLTIDRTLQWVTEQALSRAVQSANAVAGSALVLDPRTGEILAAANWPTYNLNAPGKSPRAARRNRLITDLYEPGSVFKVFSIAAAIDAGVVTATDLIDCGGGSVEIDGHTIHDSHRYGLLTVSEVMKVSSNVGAAKISAKLGKERLVEYLRSFGFGARTDVSLPGELRGMLRDADRLSQHERAAISFGQAVAATPLQVVVAAATIANGGHRMQPYLIKEIRDESGTVVLEHKPRLVRTVVSEQTAADILSMMETVVGPGGTAPAARIPGYRVAGKTGTSEKADLITGGYSKDKRIGSFVAILPADDPRLVILVVIDEPQGKKYGAVVAAPAVREIGEWAMRYLGIPPTETIEEPPSEREEALADVEPDEGFELPGSIMPPPVGKTLVPDLAGLDLRSAVQLLASRRLDVRPTGTGVIRTQSPKAGVIVSPGASVEIHLAPRG